MLELGLHGKHAFVAGVGGGIGSACVRTLASAGARVACFDLDAGVARDARSPQVTARSRSRAMPAGWQTCRLPSMPRSTRRDRSTSRST